MGPLCTLILQSGYLAGHRLMELNLFSCPLDWKGPIRIRFGKA